MENETDPFARFGLDAIDLRWTLMDITGERSRIINKQHLAQFIELGLVEMREGCARTSPPPARTRPGRINEHQAAYVLGKPADGLSRGERLPNAARFQRGSYLMSAASIAGMPPVIETIAVAALPTRRRRA